MNTLYERQLKQNKDKWEFFCDKVYYHMWAVRPKGDKDFNSQRLFHVMSEAEAEILCNLLNTHGAK